MENNESMSSLLVGWLLRTLGLIVDSESHSLLLLQQIELIRKTISCKKKKKVIIHIFGHKIYTTIREVRFLKYF